MYRPEDIDEPPTKQSYLAMVRERAVKIRKCSVQHGPSPAMDMPEPYARAAVVWYFSRFPLFDLEANIRLQY